MDAHSQAVQNIYWKHFSSIAQDAALYVIYKQAGSAYDEIHSLNKNEGYVQDDSLDNKSIYYMAEWIKENIRNKWLTTLNQEEIADGIARQMLEYFETLDQGNTEIFSSLPTNPPEVKAKEKAGGFKNEAIKNSRERNPWAAGSFYLVTAIVILVTLAIMSMNIPWHVITIILIGGVVLLSIIAAFEQRADNILTQRNFLKLIADTFRQMRLLEGKKASAPNKHRAPKNH